MAAAEFSPRDETRPEPEGLGVGMNGGLVEGPGARAAGARVG